MTMRVGALCFAAAMTACAVVVSAPHAASAGIDVPAATPMGITIQTPVGARSAGNNLTTNYQPRQIELQYYGDAHGMALYTNDNDEHDKSSCDDACAQAWPPLLAPKGARAFGEWGLSRRADGSLQWSLRGKPLYRFARDTVIGEIAGVPQDVPSESSGKPASPWKVASYSLAQIATPRGINVQEVPDANGEALVDGKGMTLYVFNGDPEKDAPCPGGICASPWQPLPAAFLANGVGDFKPIDRKDGVRQWTYKGKGLYRFEHDLAVGNVKGMDFDERWQPALVKQFYIPPAARIWNSVGRGKVIAAANGMTLYRRSASKADTLPRSVPILPEEGRIIGTRSCDQECTKTWIPFEAPAHAQPSGFWEIVRRSDGRRQWSYKGYALYRYAGDEQPGDVRGSAIYEAFTNLSFGPAADAVSAVASDIRTDSQVALIWSHMYP